MDSRRLLTLLAVIVVALVALPAAANANTVEFRGVVSGSPYGASNGYMAVPVLYSKQTMRNVGLKSPVGLLIVKKSMSVKLPNGAPRILPVNMRAGDRFKGKVPMKAAYTTSFYPRVTFDAVTVYFRSKELSVADLAMAVDALRKDLTSLALQFGSFRDASVRAFQDIYTQLADLRKALSLLNVSAAGIDLTSIQSQIDALNKKLSDLIAGLPDFTKFALLSQLPDLTSYAKLSDLTGFLKAGDVQAMINAAIAGLASQSALDAANTEINNLKTTVTNLTTRLNQVCSSLKTASVTIDPDGAGALPPVTAPVNLSSIGTPCP